MTEARLAAAPVARSPQLHQTLIMHGITMLPAPAGSPGAAARRGLPAGPARA